MGQTFKKSQEKALLEAPITFTDAAYPQNFAYHIEETQKQIYEADKFKDFMKAEKCVSELLCLRLSSPFWDAREEETS